MQLVVVLAVENGKENEAGCTNNGCKGGACGVDFLPVRSIAREFASMSKVTFKNEGQVKCYNCNGGQSNEHGFECVRANI
jgi:hypothetical protein